MYTESLNENYIFCVKSIIQVVNKSEGILLLLCSAVFARGSSRPSTRLESPLRKKKVDLPLPPTPLISPPPLPRGFLSGRLWED